MIHRLEHAMNRPVDYDYLLALCRNETPKSEAQGLLVQTVTVANVGDLSKEVPSLSACQK